MEQDCLTRARPAIQIEHCFCRILRNQAKGINLQAQGQPNRQPAVPEAAATELGFPTDPWMTTC